MPYRRTPLVTNEIYHVFNRSIARQQIFLNNGNYQRALDCIDFYRFEKPGLRFSHYNRLPDLEKSDFFKNLKLKDKRIKIYAYCLMPNHFHFVIKQLKEKGITNFISNIQESYAKYFNLKSGRTGALFQSMFKVARIETQEQFIHVVRYVHLNPLTSFLIKEFSELETYPWCSFAEYMGSTSEGIVDKEEILHHFSYKGKLKKFTLDQMEYQRKLDKIKHLTLELV